MALWTPYADDAALDLSTKCQQRSGSAPEYTDEFGYSYPYPAQTTLYPYQGYPRYVPAGEHSPLSGDSLYSYSYPAAADAALSPRAGLISPPASPPRTGPAGGARAATSSAGQGYALDVDSLSDDPDFQAFEKNALGVMAEKNGGALLGNNPRMRRAVQTNQAADDSYRKQRERNNYAAKQSRDRRKLREIHLALKVTYLRNEMAKLKTQLASRSCVRCHRAYPY